MKSMMVSEFKAKAISTLKQVRNSRTPLEITLRGEPIARIVPASETEPLKVKFDAGAGLIEDSMTLDDWERETLEDNWDDAE